jgi:glutathione S-transferase
MEIVKRAPRLVGWRGRMNAREGVKAALAMPDHTAPGLRTWTGHAR